MEETNKGIMTIRLLKEVMVRIKQRSGKFFENMNMTGPQGMLVGNLIHNGKMKISDLSEKLGLSNSTVSGIVDRLEKQGVVERIRSNEDRRVVYVDVTKEFRNNANEKFKGLEHKFEAIMNQAASDELDTILKGLETLKKVLDRQEE